MKRQKGRLNLEGHRGRSILKEGHSKVCEIKYHFLGKLISRFSDEPVEKLSTLHGSVSFPVFKINPEQHLLDVWTLSDSYYDLNYKINAF